MKTPWRTAPHKQPSTFRRPSSSPASADVGRSARSSSTAPLPAELRPDSDLDFLVTFRPSADWSLFDHVRMKREFENLTGREVDLMTRRALERSHNQLLRDEILGSARLIFSATATEDAGG